MEAAQRPLTLLPAFPVRLAVGLLAVAALLAAGMVVVTFDILAWASGDFTDADVISEPASTPVEVPLRLATALAWFVAALAWAIWLWFALAAARRLGPLRDEPALTVAMLCLPVAQWIATKRALNDIVRLSSGRGPGPLLQAWWGFVVLFMVALAVAFGAALAVADAAYFDDELPSYRADAIAYALGTLAAGLGAVVTWRLSRALRRAAADHGVVASAPPPADPATLAATAASRHELAVRMAGWGAWIAAALAAFYSALTAWALASDPDPGALEVIELAVVGPVSLAAFVPFILWLAWFHAAAAAHRARAGGPPPAWLTASWFVPPFLLVTPWRALGRVLGDADPAAGHRGLHVAWAAAVGAMAVLTVATAMAFDPIDDLATWRVYGAVTIAGYLLAVIAALALRGVTRRLG